MLAEAEPLPPPPNTLLLEAAGALDPLELLLVLELEAAVVICEELREVAVEVATVVVDALSRLVEITTPLCRAPLVSQHPLHATNCSLTQWS